MKTSLSFVPWARRCLLLFVFTTLPLSDAQCGLLGRALAKVKNRVDHTLNKIGIGRDREPSRSSDTQAQRTPEAGEPRDTPPPVDDRETSTQPPLRQPSSTPTDSSRNVSENPSVALKPSTKSQGRPQPPVASAPAPVTSEKRQQIDAGNTPVIKSNNESSSKPKTAANRPQSPTVPDATPNPPVAKITFAKPVPGKSGFVYAPGAVEEMKNILDVRGSTPGQKMRDPRTGNTFLVP